MERIIAETRHVAARPRMEIPPFVLRFFARTNPLGFGALPAEFTALATCVAANERSSVVDVRGESGSQSPSPAEHRNG